MPETPLQRRARIDSAMGRPPTVAQVTAEREAKDAATLAETKAHREGRDELRKLSPDWPLRRDNYPEEQR
ncbi:MAG: hypothetical protein AMXMBFR31_18340 [Candidatus Desulfobacillus denitrificans]